MATLQELFKEKESKVSVSLSEAFKEDDKEKELKEAQGFQIKDLFSKEEKVKNVLEGSVIDGNELKEEDTRDGFFDRFDGFWDGYKDQVIKKTYGGAVRDLAQGTIDFINWAGGKVPNVEEKIIDVNLPKIEDPEYFGGSFTRDVLGFFGGLKGVDKADKLLKIPQTTNKWIKSIRILSKGGLAEQVAFSPYEKRLSNLVEQYPAISNPVTNYLQAVGTDTEDQARAKMFVEGSLLSIPFELLANVTKGADKLKVDAGVKLKTEDTFKNLKVFSKENQEKILNSKDKVKAIDDIAKDKFNQAKNVKERLGDKARTLEGVSIPDEITRPAIKKSVTDPVEKASLEILKAGKVERNPNLKLNEQISDLIYTNRINDNQFLDILKKNKVSSKDFARFYSYNASDAGRTLQSLSVIQAQLNKLSKVPGADEAYKKLVRNNDLLDTQGGFFRRLDNIRRGAMVTQLATAVRNFESQVARKGLNVLQKGLDFGIQNIVRKLNPNAKIETFADPLEALKGFSNIFRQFRPKNFKQVKKDTDNILKYFPKEEDRLFLRFSNDVVNKGVKESLKGSPLDKLEGAVQALNIVNKGQEFITRRAVFQSSLAERISSNKSFYGNKSLTDIINTNQTSIIRQQDIAGAVDDALEVTFAKNFSEYKGGYESFANRFINFVNGIPFTTSLILPFPRFLMNSVKFHIDFSPLGILNFLSKGERKALRNGDTSKLSRMTIGIGLMSLGYYLRNQPYAGEKWYEFNVGNRTIDVRALNPFSAYLFAGDFIKKVQDGTARNYTVKDFGAAFLGVRAGTGLYLLDQFLAGWSGQNPNVKLSEVAEKAFAKAISGYAVPLQTFKDFAAQFYPEMAVVRDTSKDPIVGEFKKRIPVPSEEYPPVLSATSVEYNDQGIPVPRVFKREEPLLRQLTGLTFQAPKNAAEKELDRLQFLPREIFTRTNIPELDAELKKVLAPKIAIGLSSLVQSPAYLSLNDQTKVMVIKGALTKFKKQASESVKNNSNLVPFLLKYEIEKMSKDQRRLVDSYLGEEFLDTIIKEFVK